eukprot:752110-Hanusia_phi.AAC.3
MITRTLKSNPRNHRQIRANGVGRTDCSAARAPMDIMTSSCLRWVRERKRKQQASREAGDEGRESRRKQRSRVLQPLMSSDLNLTGGRLQVFRGRKVNTSLETDSPPPVAAPCQPTSLARPVSGPSCATSQGNFQRSAARVPHPLSCEQIPRHPLQPFLSASHQPLPPLAPPATSPAALDTDLQGDSSHVCCEAGKVDEEDVVEP